MSFVPCATITWRAVFADRSSTGRNSRPGRDGKTNAVSSKYMLMPITVEIEFGIWKSLCPICTTYRQNKREFLSFPNFFAEKFLAGSWEREAGRGKLEEGS